MTLPITVWIGFKRLLDKQLALHKTKKRSSLEYLILATLGCILAAALKYPNRAFLTAARPDLKARRIDTPGLPLLGSLVQVIRNRHQQLHFFQQGFLEHGDIMSMTILGIGRVHFVNNPKFMEHILKTNFDNYIKGDVFRWQLTDILGKGIFVSDGAEWRFHRKTASNIFTTRLYRDLVQGAFKSSAQDLCSVLDQHSGEAVDMQSLFLRLTLDAFGKLTFGLEFNALVTEGPNEFGDAFDFLTSEAELRVANPLWPLTDRILFWRHLRTRRAIGVLHKWAARAVQARRAETVEEMEARRSDLLDHFITHQTDDGTMLTDTELNSIFVNFMIAGRDTTAQALTWQFYSLMADPRIMANIVREIDVVLGGDERKISYEVLMHELPYTKAVFHETLRLHPAVPKNLKQAVADDVLPDGTRVYAGELVGYSNWCMGRNKNVWGQDAELFVPERWLVPRETDDVKHGTESSMGVSPFGKFKPESQFKFISFNAGPRLCLGTTFATLEALETTCMLLQKYEFRLAPGQSTPVIKGSVTLPMVGGLMGVVTPRTPTRVEE
ncbi:hypothetical protein BGZ82_006289 [Podila clonocystis]|nr:hypothetical protein BGZ82_006289 [Podila clonocystis]